MTAALKWKSGQETCSRRKPHKTERRRGRRHSCCPHGEEMKRALRKGIFIIGLSSLILSGCSISFSDGVGLGNDGTETEEVTTPSGAVEAVEGGNIKLEDMTLKLPNGMKYGEMESEAGKIYYVWDTEKEYVLPTDTDVILYVYEGMDSASPDTELEDREARYSMTQTYMQTFRESMNASLIPDPSAVLNNKWYVCQMTGYSGEYIMTTYGTMCYPKYYYGIYTLQKEKDEGKYSRRYYGFVFSNDGEGNIMEEIDYNSLFGQIKSSFGLTEFYSAPQLEYEESKDYSNGYSYSQYETLFEDATNYYGMSAEQAEKTETETPQEIMGEQGQQGEETAPDND